MARTKRTRRSSSSKPNLRARASAALHSLREQDWTAWRRLGRVAAWLFFFGALSSLWALGVPHLSRAASAARAGDVPNLEMTRAPEWVDRDALAHLHAQLIEAISGDPLAQDELARARQILLDSGWFTHVPQIERTHGGTVRIFVHWPVAVAAVRDPLGDHLVDARGRLLPRMFNHGSAEGFTMLTGVKTPRPTRPGETWEGVDLAAGLTLGARLRSRVWIDQVRAIDVARVHADHMLEIHTDRGAVIEWGAAPGEEASLEISADEKLHYLDQALANYGRIDCGYAGRWYFLREGLIAR